MDVPALDGAFVVNIGELLEVATGGYLRATEHRVELRSMGRWVRAAERISIAYFFNPRLDAQVPVLSLPGRAGCPLRIAHGPFGSDLLCLRPERLEEPIARSPGCRGGSRLRAQVGSIARIPFPA